MQKLCRLLAQVPSLEITGFIPYPSNLLQNPSKPHPANTATLWGTHLLNLLMITIDKSRLIKKLGKLEKNRIQEVDEAMKLSLGLKEDEIYP